MDSNEFDAEMRSREMYHGLTILNGAWPVLRVDGRGFSKFTLNEGYEKPFDERFSDLMIITMLHLLQSVQGIYGYVESDEISILLPRDTDLFKRSVEKLVSLSAAAASAQFSVVAQTPVQFDSRLWVGATIEDVKAYFSWRQADAYRCALNGYAYWTLRKEGLSKTKATSVLDGVSPAFKRDLLHERGIDFDQTPLWQRRGVGAYYMEMPKIGVNPITGEERVVLRRSLNSQFSLPYGETYRNLIGRLCEDSLKSKKEKHNG